MGHLRDYQRYLGKVTFYLILNSINRLPSYLQPFSDDLPHADIHELMAGDLLHQVIKGCFKEHLVDWVFAYIILEHGETVGHGIWGQIDRRYVLL